jgi:pyruvate/2-oxoglutarate dehydrogenase complex dihydrolipoamide dehydrogenase (E3) component
VAVIGGDMIGLSIARFLRDRGHSVTVLEPGAHFGLAMAMPRRWTTVIEARERGIELVREADDAAIAAAEAGADHVIDTRVSVDAPASSTLSDALGAAGIECHTVGDASGVGYLFGAMRGAHDVATKL